MTRHAAEKWLGGYATGTLTETERKQLFAAALKDQRLFDALMDEEGLRALLADPAMRAQVLDALAGPAVAVPKPLWRRPSVVGLAASLFALVATGLVVWRLPDGEVRVAATAPSLASQEASELKLAPAPPPPQEPVAKPIPPKQARRVDAPKQKVAPKAEATEQPPTFSRGLESPAPLLEEEAQAEVAPLARSELSKSAPMPSASKAQKMPPPRADETPRPFLQKQPDGIYRLTVAWRAREHMVVLHRTASGVERLVPGTTGVDAEGFQLGTFALPLASSDALDLYWLPKPVAEPEKLSPAQPVGGRWLRLLPE